MSIPRDLLHKKFKNGEEELEAWIDRGKELTKEFEGLIDRDNWGKFHDLSEDYKDWLNYMWQTFILFDFYEIKKKREKGVHGTKDKTSSKSV